MNFPAKGKIYLIYFGVSVNFISKKFKDETGENLIDFILKEKTEEAKRLLRYTDKSLNAISNYLGFSSQSHFTRVFKKYSGNTPNEYRQRYNNWYKEAAANVIFYRNRSLYLALYFIKNHPCGIPWFRHLKVVYFYINKSSSQKFETAFYFFNMKLTLTPKYIKYIFPFAGKFIFVF